MADYINTNEFSVNAADFLIADDCIAALKDITFLYSGGSGR